VDCRVNRGALIVTLSDGREVRSALSRYPRLAHATPEALAHWRLVGRGIGIHWPDVDEDLSVAGLLRDGIVSETSKTFVGGYSATVLRETVSSVGAHQLLSSLTRAGVTAVRMKGSISAEASNAVSVSPRTTLVAGRIGTEDPPNRVEGRLSWEARPQALPA
jgi:hypothetical protein